MVDEVKPAPASTPIPSVDPAPPLGQGPGEHPMPPLDPTAPILSGDAQAKAEKAAYDKAVTEKVLADQEHGAKILGDMEAAIRVKLVKICDEFNADFLKLHTDFADMPDEVKEHTLYKPLGEKISSVEALLNTLMHTTASFPEPASHEPA